MPITSNEQKLINAVKDLTKRLKSEQVKVFKNDMVIKMMTEKISELKGQLQKLRAKPTPSSFNPDDFFRKLNTETQAELNISDAEIKAEMERIAKQIESIQPKF